MLLTENFLISVGTGVGSRRDVHVFLADQGFEYVGSLVEDDFFYQERPECA